MGENLEIKWYGSSGDLEISDEGISSIETYINENGEELHEIFHFAVKHEIEIGKIIDGKQFSGEDGALKIISYELYILPNIILIISSEEIQDPKNNESVKKNRYLGEVLVD